MFKSQFAGKVERGGRIVGFPASECFSAQEIRAIAPKLNTYLFLAEPDYKLRVRATTLRNALRAIGYGSDYEAEWGDYRGIIYHLRKRTGEVEIVKATTTYTPML